MLVVDSLGPCPSVVLWAPASPQSSILLFKKGFLVTLFRYIISNLKQIRPQFKRVTNTVTCPGSVS